MSIDPRPDAPKSGRRRGRPPKASTAPPAPSAPPPVSPIASTHETVRLIKMAADPTRLHLLTALRNGRRNVSELCANLRTTQAAVSHHLAMLRAGRLVDSQRTGKFNYYALTSSGRALIETIAQLEI